VRRLTDSNETPRSGLINDSDIFHRASPVAWWMAWSLLPFGLASGWLIAWACGCDRRWGARPTSSLRMHTRPRTYRDQRVIGIVTGVQNTTIGIAVASISFEGRQRDVSCAL
jgi:hypothetical protein